MDKDRIIETLRQHQFELNNAGIVHLRLHGSMARGTATFAASDVDLIADFDRAKRFTLLDMTRLESRLSDIFGLPVDLSPSHTLKSAVAEKAAREAVLAF
jgi:predicted nucleotidyltransferase